MVKALDNLKSLFSNTRARVLLVFTFGLLLTVIIIGFIKFGSSGKEEGARAKVSRAPATIGSIPGKLDQTAAYAALQEEQNQQQAEQASKTGGSAIPTIIRTQSFDGANQLVGPQGGKGGVGFTTLSYVDQAGMQKKAWLEDIKLHQCSEDSVKRVLNQGATLKDLKDDCSCKKLKSYGYQLTDLKEACACRKLKALGYTATELKDVGLNAYQLHECGFSACAERQAGFTAQQMKDGGFSDGELKGAGFSPEEIARASGLPDGITAADIRKAGCNVEALKRLREAGVSAAAIRRINGCSAEQLLAAGYTPEDLRQAGFTAAQLKNAGVSPEALMKAGYSARDLMNAGDFPAALKNAGYSASQIGDAEDELPPGMTDEDIKKAGCSPAAIRRERLAGVSAKKIREIAGCSAAALKAAGYTDADLANAGFTPQQIVAAGKKGVSDDEIRAAGCSPDALRKLREEGVSAERIVKLNGCSAAQLRAAGFTPAEIAAAMGNKVSDDEIRAAGCSPDALRKLREEGVSAERIVKLNGCSAAQLRAAGFSPEEIVAAMANKALEDAIRAAGCDPGKLRELRERGVTAEQIERMNGCSAAQLRAAGFSPEDIAAAMGNQIGDDAIRAAGCSPEALKKLREEGVSAERIVKLNGCSAAQLRAAGFSPEDIAAAMGNQIGDDAIRAAGCSPEALKKLREEGVSAARIVKLNGCSAAQLRAAGYTAKELANAGFTPAELLKAGFTPAELAAAGLKPSAVIATGRTADCSVESLKAARAMGVSASTIRKTLGCSASAMKAAGYTAKELKDAGYTAGELKDAGFTASELKAAGFTAKELADAGFGLDALKNAGYSAKDLKDAGFSAAQLKAAGFGAKALADAGFGADALKKAGLSSAELSTAGLTPLDTNVTGLESVKDKALNSALESMPATKDKDTKKPDLDHTKQLNQILTKQQLAKAATRYQQKIQQQAGAMTSAANKLLQGWKEVPTQTYVAAGKKSKGKGGEDDESEIPAAHDQADKFKKAQQSDDDSPSAWTIKTGDILFAVIDTSVNTDEPGPILATIVSGAFKGAKLIGSFNLPSNADKMVITFNTMSLPGAPKTIPINAYAIDPDTARTALASRSNHHYLQRYGSLFASSFLEGMGNAFQSADTTVSIGGTGGTTDTTVQNGIDRSTLDNAVIALGTVGKAWGQEAKKQFNRPTTVEVFSGTGVGILFTQDVDPSKS